MPDFTYVALAKTGARSTGTLTATSERDAAALLDAKGLFPVEVRPARSASKGGRFRRGVGGRLLATFYGQLADLLQAGRAAVAGAGVAGAAKHPPPAPGGRQGGPAQGRRRHRPGPGDGHAPARLRRAGRQHGPGRPGGRLPRRRAQAHRRLRRAPAGPQGQGRRLARLPGVPGRRRVPRPQHPGDLLRPAVRGHLLEDEGPGRPAGPHAIPDGAEPLHAVVAGHRRPRCCSPSGPSRSSPGPAAAAAPGPTA